jgi:hypothetical protein
LVARNFRMGRLEGDLLLRDEEGSYFIWEVKGRVSGAYRPSLMISPRKLGFLRLLAGEVQRRTSARVRLQLIELIGMPPRVTSKIFEIENS